MFRHNHSKEKSIFKNKQLLSYQIYLLDRWQKSILFLNVIPPITKTMPTVTTWLINSLLVMELLI